MKFFALLLVFLSVTPAYADLSVGVAKQYARVIYDVNLNGGASTSHDLDAVLPAGAIVTDAWVYINTAFVDGGTGSLALECGATRNIMDWQDVGGDAMNTLFKASRAGESYVGGSFIVSGATEAVSGVTSVPAACEVKAVVRSDSGYTPYTAGKATLLLEYFRQ